MYKVDEEYFLEVAGSYDLSDLVALCEEATEVSPFSSMKRTREQTEASILNWIQDKEKFLVLTLWCDIKMVGVLIGFITQDHPSLDMNVAMELVWYVQPAHRKVKASLTMVEAFEYWARKKGAKATIMADYGRKLEKLYNRKGYRTLETTYIKEF